MSHAAVIVAPTREQISALGIEGAIQFEMEPFDESGTWFRDGSRWDWYVVGGRYTGLLDGYEPDKDPRNFETCKQCEGSGIRPGGVEQFGQAWFDACNGCNGCHGKGKSLKYRFESHANDIMQVKKLPKIGADFDAATAFLRNRHWHEAERLGWFGTSTYTECELKDMEKPVADPDKWFGKCLHKDEASGAQIVCWNEPWEVWKEQYFKRFIAPLNPEDQLIVVDYHV